MKIKLVPGLMYFIQNIVGGSILLVAIAVLFLFYSCFSYLVEPRTASLNERLFYDWHALMNPENIGVEIINTELDDSKLTLNIFVNNIDQYRYSNILIEAGLFINDFQVKKCDIDIDYLNTGINQKYKIFCYGLNGSKMPDNLKPKIGRIFGYRLIPKIFR